MTTTPTRPNPSRNPFEVPLVTQAEIKAKAKPKPRRKTSTTTDRYVTIWRDPDSTHGGLLTFADGKRTATRDHDAVTRATDPTPHVLSDSKEDRALLDEWLQDANDGPIASQYPYLAVPSALVRDILGWDL